MKEGHTIAFVTDITARRRAEEALRQSHAALEDRTAELEMRTAQLSRLASELTLAEQNAREQLAKTLHDGLQQLLFIAKTRLDRILKVEESQRTDQAASLALVRSSIEEGHFVFAFSQHGTVSPCLAYCGIAGRREVARQFDAGEIRADGPGRH
jgi:ABC-type transporter Mla subunit MlaD